MRSSVHTYQIRIHGHLSNSWASRLGGLSLQRVSSGDTLLQGELLDQAALHGVLMVIRDLGLTLVEVKCLDCNAEK
ncbi:MAG: hypothetical protein ACK2U1_07310 [Anaerolineales bacterium]